MIVLTIKKVYTRKVPLFSFHKWYWKTLEKNVPATTTIPSFMHSFHVHLTTTSNLTLVRVFLSVRSTLSAHYCSSSQDGLSEPGGFSLTLNCIRVCSNCCWLPAKYAEVALWKRSSCLCITLTYKTQQKKTR